ncbi:uncharacterized protein [Drosophila pseudoobscura]|uniref:Uncharacterized protein isoform X1 n=1 Tax=Drosophila pseudoobscura pseudoobscura TaxID=46245 RepID=A0A6I8W9Y1_DROPS|nr:uncharacterized protein LOC117184977 isoform X1 [Drosophila pseudoobscura]
MWKLSAIAGTFLMVNKWLKVKGNKKLVEPPTKRPHTIPQCAVAHVTFTNLKCQMIDRRFGLFEMCRIKAVNRTHKYMDIYAKIYKLPVDNITCRILPMRHDHGYRPFFMNLTFDFCGFFRSLRTEHGIREILLQELFQTVKQFTNVNHSCPYNHDLVISKMWTGNLETRFLRYIPLPQGDYSLSFYWFTVGVHRATVRVYFRLTGG